MRRRGHQCHETHGPVAASTRSSRGHSLARRHSSYVSHGSTAAGIHLAALPMAAPKPSESAEDRKNLARRQTPCANQSRGAAGTHLAVGHRICATQTLTAYRLTFAGPSLTRNPTEPRPAMTLTSQEAIETQRLTGGQS